MPEEGAETEKTEGVQGGPGANAKGSRRFPWRELAILLLIAHAASVIWWLAAGRVSMPAPIQNFISRAFHGTPGTIQVIVGTTDSC